MAERDIDATRLANLLEYDPGTGNLFWRVRPLEMFRTLRACRSWNGRYAGKEALTCICDEGYLTGILLGTPVKAHRVIIALVEGFFPDGEVDHINGDRADNRLKNLRVVTHQENARNKFRHRGNTTGATGVYWRRDNQSWVAKIGVDYKQIHLGCFKTFDEAIAARATAMRRFGFSPRHGVEAIANKLHGRRK